MNKSKYRAILIILSLIIFISGTYISLDWARLFVIKEELKHNNLLYTYIAKSLIVILSTILVFIIGKDGLNPKDTKRLKFIYIFIILADISLVIFEKPYIGIFLFSVAQLGLIFRNGKGIFEKYKVDNLCILKENLFVNILLFIVLFILIMVIIMKDLLRNKNLFYVFLFYAILLSISLLTAIANLLLKVFPRPNSILITIGMLSFLLCDLNVGFTMALETSTISLITDSIIWIFYAPALTLIALSGFNFSKLKA